MKGDYSLLDIVRYQLYQANIRSCLNCDMSNKNDFKWRLDIGDNFQVSIEDNKYFISQMNEVVYVAFSVFSCFDEIIWRCYEHDEKTIGRH